MLPEAEKHFDEPLLESFRAFCRLWYARYDWENPNMLRYYLILSIKERREIFQRFVRESRSWDDSLRIVASGEPLDPAAGQSPNSTAYWREQRRRRVQSLDERASRTHDFYERLAKEAGTYTHSLRLPWIVREAFHTLGLPAGTPAVEVRSAFRRLAFRHHPDRTGDHAIMSELNRAYRVLMKFFGNR
jgi:curved DNA-binding protein CbpA